MANRRMFCKDITESDAFLSMPLSSQALYYHLGMNGDDDWFLASAKKIVRMISASEDDFKLLVAKRFVLMFDKWICVVKHRKINNQIRSDRYKETAYTKEMSMLRIKENGSYTEVSKLDTIGIPNDNQMDTVGMRSIVEVSVVEERGGKDSPIDTGGENPKPKTSKKVTTPKKEFIPPTLEQVKQFFQENGYLEKVAIHVWNYYNDADWHDSYWKKVWAWKQKIRGNWFKDENKDKSKSRWLTEAQRQERLNALS